MNGSLEGVGIWPFGTFDESGTTRFINERMVSFAWAQWLFVGDLNLKTKKALTIDIDVSLGENRLRPRDYLQNSLVVLYQRLIELRIH